MRATSLQDKNQKSVSNTVLDARRQSLTGPSLTLPSCWAWLEAWPDWRSLYSSPLSATAVLLTRTISSYIDIYMYSVFVHVLRTQLFLDIISLIFI